MLVVVAEVSWAEQCFCKSNLLRTLRRAQKLADIVENHEGEKKKAAETEKKCD